MEKLYILTLCDGEKEAETVTAILKPEQVEEIKKDIAGELNKENLITLTDGRIIESGIIDDIKTPLQVAKYNNLIVFRTWKSYGQPEAWDKLNDSNRELIKAYAEEYPAAMGLKVNAQRENEGIFKIANVKILYNFCCEWIFNGTAENFEAVRAAAKQWRNSGKIDDLKRLEAILQAADGICMVWS